MANNCVAAMLPTHRIAEALANPAVIALCASVVGVAFIRHSHSADVALLAGYAVAAWRLVRAGLVNPFPPTLVVPATKKDT
jgi:hypothetical protein